MYKEAKGQQGFIGSAGQLPPGPAVKQSLTLPESLWGIKGVQSQNLRHFVGLEDPDSHLDLAHLLPKKGEKQQQEQSGSWPRLDSDL